MSLNGLKRVVLFLMIFSIHEAYSNEIILAAGGKSDYIIIIPENASPIKLKAADVFRKYFRQVTGVSLKIESNLQNSQQPFIGIGFPGSSDIKHSGLLKNDGYYIFSEGKNLIINGDEGKGVLYGVYTFIERYLGCRKYDGSPAKVPSSQYIKIPSDLSVVENPAFSYREVYMPVSEDNEYLDWHKLNRFEELWGLWGHSFSKLLPSKIYFKEHPEYFSLVNGIRKPTQLCLSNDSVFQLVMENLKARFDENPDAQFWSISPNDGNGYCECVHCKKMDDHEGGPQGSLINFVNKIAKQFPEKTFSTLAYLYSKHPPLYLKPANNVYIILSTIDAFRSQPLSKEKTASMFRKDLVAWQSITNNLIVWDYCTQFTNYVAPFPNMSTFGDNIRFLFNNKVSGILEQGSGSTYSDMQELKSYLLAKLLWDPGISVENVISDFLSGYYGGASNYIKSYIELLEKAIATSNTNLDIYGNPVNDSKGYLSPELMDAYSSLMDQAEASTENDLAAQEKILRIRLSQEYTFLQQSRLYGIGPYGIFVKSEDGAWKARDGFLKRLERFKTNCLNSGVREYAEGGLTPDDYFAEWQQIIKNGVRHTIALNADVSLDFPAIKDYMWGLPSTLTDGNSGYQDFSYNWLCFANSPLIATINFSKKITVSSVKIDFLVDPRHWFFSPKTVEVLISENGKFFISIGKINSDLKGEQDFDIEKAHFNFTNPDPSRKVRYIKIKSSPQPELPEWQWQLDRKPIIACDEIWVE